jgi:hypothetical protein
METDNKCLVHALWTNSALKDPRVVHARKNSPLIQQTWEKHRRHGGVNIVEYSLTCVGRDSVIGIATGPSGDWISVGGAIFRTRPDWLWGPRSLLYNVYQVSFTGIKRPGSAVDHPPLPNAEVKERVELYLYSLSGLSWPVRGWPLPLPTCKNIRND